MDRPCSWNKLKSSRRRPRAGVIGTNLTLIMLSDCTLIHGPVMRLVKAGFHVLGYAFESSFGGDVYRISSIGSLVKQRADDTAVRTFMNSRRELLKIRNETKELFPFFYSFL